jgi:hypothetical protein
MSEDSKPPSYSVYVHRGRQRLTLKRSLPLEEAQAFANELRRLRFHNPEAVVVVHDGTGEEVPSPAIAASLDTPETSATSSDVTLVLPLHPDELATLEQLARAEGLTPVAYLRALIQRAQHEDAPPRTRSRPVVRVDSRAHRRPR